MRFKRMIAVLALAAGTVGVSSAVAAPIASAFGDSPSASASDQGDNTQAGRGWRVPRR